MLAAYLERLHKLKCADKLLTMATRIKRRGDEGNVSCVFSCLTLWLWLLLLCCYPATPQTNSQPSLIRSSTENVFVERKEIFRAENTGDIGDPRVFGFRKMANLICVRWLWCGRIYFPVFSFPFNFRATLDSFSHGCELTVRWRARSYELSAYARHPGLHA